MLRRYLTLGFIALSASCAQRPGPFDTTHPNYTEKMTLQGEWYYREMVTDVQTLAAYTQDIQENFLIIGASSPLHRIRWEIHETELVGLATDEFMPGANDAGANRELEETVVARYPITSHFDRRYQFDKATGEETNVLYEDTSSRKWYERQYMRVDWSSNAAVSLDNLFPGETALINQIDDMADNDAFQMEVTENHLTLVNDHPVKVSFSWVDEYGMPQTYDYATSKITLLTSILRVDPDSDYPAMDFPAQVKQRDADGNFVLDEDGEPVQVDMFNRYGFFQTMRQNYDRFDASLDNNRYYYINRFSLFDRYTDDQGRDIPVTQRTLKPIVYFVAEDYPSEMMPAAQRIGTIWNKGFLKALTDVGYPVRPDTVAFAICENPVTTSSPAVCQQKGIGLKLFGDLRYNFLKLALPTGTVNPLGYGPGSHDPNTGETINAWAVTYYAGLNTYAKRALDMVKMYNGQVDAQSLEWLEGDYYQGLQQTLKRTFGNEDMGNSDTSEIAALFGPEARRAAKLLKTPELQKFVRQTQANMHEAMGGRSIIEAMANADFRAAPSYATMGDDAFEGFIPNNTSGPLDQAALDNVRANPGRELLKSMVKEDGRLRALADDCIYVDEFADPTVGYIAARMARKYPYPAAGTPDRAERIAEIDARILKEIRDAIYVGVQLHEVGHNLGLRHNFAGSTDELNYIEPGVSSVEIGGDVWAGADIDAQKGYWDVATDANGDMLERLEYQYSSIMDYGANFASDLHGIGAYDIGAIRFGYLGHIEVFEDGYPMDAMYDAPAGTPDHVARQAVFDKLQNRHYVEFDANAVRKDPDNYQEYIEDGGERLYINKHSFCTDTFADSFDLFCSRFDIGRDPFEIQQLYSDRLRENYWFMNYRRGRSDAEYSFNSGLINGVVQRYFMYAIRSGLLASYINAIYGHDTVEWLESNDSLRVFHEIGAIALNDVINTLMTPDAAAYDWNTDGTAPEFAPVYGDDAVGAVELANGPYVHPTWSDYGYNKDEYITINRYGFFNNKLAGVLSLFAGFQVNLEQFQEGDIRPGLGALSLANTFKAETAEMLKSFLTGETNRYAHVPVVGEYIAEPGDAPDQAFPGDRVMQDLMYLYGQPGATVDDTMPRVNHGATSYEFEFGYHWATAYMNTPWDRTWQRYIAIRRAGDSLGSDVSADPSRVVSWSDTGTGYVWQAYRQDPVRAINGLNVDPSVGAYFLTWINDKVADYNARIAAGTSTAAAKEVFLDYVRYKLDFMYSVQEIYAYR